MPRSAISEGILLAGGDRCAYAYAMALALRYALIYYRESRERAVRASQLETRLVEAQLKTLQQQLQLHFLFNTLHAISALMHKDVDAADRTLMQLSDLLRLDTRAARAAGSDPRRGASTSFATRDRAHALRGSPGGQLRRAA